MLYKENGRQNVKKKPLDSLMAIRLTAQIRRALEAAAQDVIEEEMLSAHTENRVANLLGQVNETQSASDPCRTSPGR